MELVCSNKLVNGWRAILPQRIGGKLTADLGLAGVIVAGFA